MLTSRLCPYCLTPAFVEVDAKAYNRWQVGTLIQEAFPDMSIDDREMLQTGYHPDCWDKEFASQ